MDKITISEIPNGIKYSWSSGRTISVLHNKTQYVEIVYDSAQEDYKFFIVLTDVEFYFFYKQVVSPTTADAEALRTQILAWSEYII